MKSCKESLLLYAVTSRAWTTDDQSLVEQVEEALQGGATMIQLREKNVSEQFFYDNSLEIQKVCKKYNVPLLINDNVDLAIKIQADGVHVGQSDDKASEVRQRIGDNMILGVSCQTIEQAIKAQQDGANYIGVGAIFTTQTKQDVQHTSVDNLTDICQSINIPVVAIGGIKENNIKELKGSGMAGIAIVSDIFSANNIKEKTSSLLLEVKRVIADEI